jgi:glycosyltransferase involved in cell wall biosynthesis
MRQSSALPMFSLIVPIYKSEVHLEPLLASFDRLAEGEKNKFQLEVVFVVDGSPDASFDILNRELKLVKSFKAQLCELSRNFGAFEAVRAGLELAKGDYCAIYSADMQEPLHLITDAFLLLESDQIDICFGKRLSRDDPFLSRCAARLFWGLYRRVIDSNVPSGGTDIVICNRKVRDAVLSCNERHSTLIGLFYWVGFRRAYVSYRRQKRLHGRSTWTFSKKVKYLLDSLFAFSDLPLKILLNIGFAGTFLSLVLGAVVTALKLSQAIEVPGYAATIIVVLFFGGLNSMGIGLLGEYVWRTFENTKQRPITIKSRWIEFEGGLAQDKPQITGQHHSV